MQPAVQDLFVQNMQSIVAEVAPLLSVLFQWVAGAVLFLVALCASVAVSSAVRRLRMDEEPVRPTLLLGLRDTERSSAARDAFRFLRGGRIRASQFGRTWRN
jgi:hypothetical protein